MDDIVTYALLTASAFFVVLGVALLARYRQVSQRISASSDLGHDLWEALEARLKKQDERILDMMGRVEVIQSRAVESRTKPTSSLQVGSNAVPVGPQPEAGSVEEGTSQGSGIESHAESQVTRPQEPKPEFESKLLTSLESRFASQDELLAAMTNQLEAIQSRLEEERQEPPVRLVAASQPQRQSHAHEAATKVDEKALLSMLAERPRTSVEIRERFRITREHASRVLNELFAKQLAVRNEEHKPYVYELTEAGRRSIVAS